MPLALLKWSFKTRRWKSSSRWRIFFSPEFALSSLQHFFITAPLLSWPPNCSFPFPSVFLPYSTSLSTFMLPEKAGDMTLPLSLSCDPFHLSASPQAYVFLVVAWATGQELPAPFALTVAACPAARIVTHRIGFSSLLGLDWWLQKHHSGQSAISVIFFLQFIEIQAHPSKIQFVAQLSTLVRGGHWFLDCVGRICAGNYTLSLHPILFSLSKKPQILVVSALRQRGQENKVKWNYSKPPRNGVELLPA